MQLYTTVRSPLGSWQYVVSLNPSSSKEKYRPIYSLSVSQLIQIDTYPSISLQWNSNGPKLTQIPSGFSVAQMVFTYSKTLLAVSRKKQVATPQKCSGLLEQTNVNSPPVILNSGSPLISSVGARSGTVTLLNESSSLQQQLPLPAKGYMVNCSLFSLQFMMKFDPKSMKQVNQFPSAPNPAWTNSNTNRPSPHPGTSIRSPSERYSRHLSAMRVQSNLSVESAHHSRQNCLSVVLILERLLRVVCGLGVQLGSLSSAQLMNSMIWSRNAWLCFKALSSIIALRCWFCLQNSLLVMFAQRAEFSSRRSREQLEKADLTSTLCSRSSQSLPACQCS